MILRACYDHLEEKDLPAVKNTPPPTPTENVNETLIIDDTEMNLFKQVVSFMTFSRRTLKCQCQRDANGHRTSYN